VALFAICNAVFCPLAWGTSVLIISTTGSQPQLHVVWTQILVVHIAIRSTRLPWSERATLNYLSADSCCSYCDSLNQTTME
jgi:hypothetical protein